MGSYSGISDALEILHVRPLQAGMNAKGFDSVLGRGIQITLHICLPAEKSVMEFLSPGEESRINSRLPIQFS